MGSENEARGESGDAGRPAGGSSRLRVQDVREIVRESGTTVFLTTHNLHEAEEMCDEVAVLRSGRIVAQGRPDSLRGDVAPVIHVRGSGFTAPLLQKLRRRKEVAAAAALDGTLEVRLNGEASAAPLVDLLVRGGASIEEVVRPRASLEDSFLAILESTP